MVSSEHERYHGLGPGALVIVWFFWKTNSWFGHGCSEYRMVSSEHERYHGLGLGFGHACSGYRMGFFEHERYCGLA